MDIESLIDKHEVKWLGHKPEWRSAMRAALTEMAAGYEQETELLRAQIKYTLAQVAERDARIVACVNACADEDTHFLEYIVSEGKTLRSIREDELANTSRFVRELNAAEGRIRQLEAERVPDGWQLVPKEPTEEMCKVQTWDFNRFYPPAEIWKAMLAAAPQPKKEPRHD